MSWICRFGLDVRGREMGSRRVGDGFDRMIASFEELFDVARRDPIALTVRGKTTVVLTSSRLIGRGPAVAYSSSMGSSAMAAIV